MMECTLWFPPTLPPLVFLLSVSKKNRFAFFSFGKIQFLPPWHFEISCSCRNAFGPRALKSRKEPKGKVFLHLHQLDCGVQWVNYICLPSSCTFTQYTPSYDPLLPFSYSKLIHIQGGLLIICIFFCDDCMAFALISSPRERGGGEGRG